MTPGIDPARDVAGRCMELIDGYGILTPRPKPR